jgi:polyhydroxybutyrate depolymerase
MDSQGRQDGQDGQVEVGGHRVAIKRSAMRRAVVGALLVCGGLVNASAASGACDGLVPPSGPVTLEVASARRMFVVRVPSAADGRAPLPVLFAFHPFGMNAQYIQSRVSSRVWPEAIMVYPEGLPRGGAPGPSWQGRAGEHGDQDLLFFDAMLAWLGERACVDEKRVFVLGYSNGAGLANLLACERPDAIAGVALAAGRPTCAPVRPAPVVIGHGTRDATIGYEQAIAASQAWSKVNGCSAPPRAGTPGCFAASSCTGAPVILCTHQGGHEYSPPFTREAVGHFRAR